MNNRMEDLKKLEGLDQLVESGLEDWKVPGMALSVVKDGEMVFSNGYGFSDPAQGLKMNADTLVPDCIEHKSFCFSFTCYTSR